MDIGMQLADAYLQGRLRLPRAVVQGLLNAYLRAYYLLEPWLAEGPTSPAETAEIAERSRELMETHYNLPLAVFANFLGPSMKYSMALWEQGAADLEQAQDAMLADLCTKAGIEDGMRILDIGCGFGSFAMHALRCYPRARVYGLTLSQTQADYLRARQAEPGHPLHTDRFYPIQADFNDVTFDQPFDRIVSIGVFEHVSNLTLALERMRGFLTDEGRCFLHYIVYRPRKDEAGYVRQNAFIERYVFPGGRIWSEQALGTHPRHLRIEQQWYLNGVNYKRTLQAWLANYLRNLGRIRRDSHLTSRQLRLWELYLRSCVAVFNTSGGWRFGNGQYLLRPT